MKKILSIFALILALALPSLSWGAIGSCVETSFTVYPGTNRAVLIYTCTGGTAGETGTYPATAFATATWTELRNRGFFLYKVITNPGAVPPEDNWDFTLVDGDGIDVLGGAGANRHTTNSQMIAPLIAADVRFAQPVLDAWTLTVTGNTTASAVIVFKFDFER